MERHAIVTGAGSGLGRALARQLAREGWSIALCDINEIAAQESKEIILKEGGDAFVEYLDVADFDSWTALSHRLRGRWQHLDLLVNNAGVAGGGDVGEFSIDDWRWLIGINLWNGIYGCHVFVDWLKANPNGAHIINTASMAAIASAPNMAAYNVAKAGMLSLSETLYIELKPHRVGVTVLCPAFFSTNLLKTGRFSDSRMKTVAEKFFETSKLTAEEVARQAVLAMRKKQLYVVLPLEARIQWRLKRLAPQWFLSYIERIVAKTPRPSEPVSR